MLWAEEYLELKRLESTGQLTQQSRRKLVLLTEVFNEWLFESLDVKGYEGGNITFPSRLLYPFALLLKETPTLQDKVIFLSDTNWFKSVYNLAQRISLVDAIRLNYETKSPVQHKFDKITQSVRPLIKSALTVLSPKNSKLKKQLTAALRYTFKGGYELSNIFTHKYSLYGRGDVFVRMTAIRNNPKLVRVTLGFIRNFASLLERVKKICNPELAATEEEKVVFEFYKDYYLANKRVFLPSEIPHAVNLFDKTGSTCGLETGITIKPIMTMIVDLDREYFLQETFFGKLLFGWHKFWYGVRPYQSGGSNAKNDLTNLEEYLQRRFKNLENAIVRYQLTVNAGI